MNYFIPVLKIAKATRFFKRTETNFKYGRYYNFTIIK